jgi:hypothetical protein
MSNVEGHLGAVVCLSLGMFLSTSNQAAAQEQPIAPAVHPAIASDAGLRTALRQATPARRPPVLVPLYVSFGIMQVLDVSSTQAALAGGAREGNPIMGGIAKSPIAMAALKGGVTAGIIVVSEKMWKRNRVATVLTMVALNSTYAMVVSHNYSNAR